MDFRKANPFPAVAAVVLDTARITGMGSRSVTDSTGKEFLGLQWKRVDTPDAFARKQLLCKVASAGWYQRFLCDTDCEDEDRASGIERCQNRMVAVPSITESRPNGSWLGRGQIV